MAPPVLFTASCDARIFAADFARGAGIPPWRLPESYFFFVTDGNSSRFLESMPSLSAGSCLCGRHLVLVSVLAVSTSSAFSTAPLQSLSPSRYSSCRRPGPPAQGPTVCRRAAAACRHKREAPQSAAARLPPVVTTLLAAVSAPRRPPAGVRPPAALLRSKRRDAEAGGEGACAADAKQTRWSLLRVRFEAWLVAIQRRVLSWVIGFFPLTGLIRASLRWYAFSASRAELSLAISLMRDAVLPVCTGALAVAELREEVLGTCSDGSCSLEVQEALDASVASVERELSAALEAALAEFDADGDGVVTVAEVRDTLANSSRLASQQRLVAVLEAAKKATDTVAQARTFVDDTVRLVDEDGDGVITLAEAIRAPRRLFDQWWSSRK